MSEITVMAYNISDGLSDKARRHEILDFVGDVKPNIAFFSEAYVEEAGLGVAGLALEAQRYKVTHGSYEDTDGRKDRHGFVGITNLSPAVDKTETYGNRNGYKLVSPYVDAYGIHGKDRGDDVSFKLPGVQSRTIQRGSQERQNQVSSLPEQFTRPSIVFGDFNALDGKTLKALSLRTIRPLANLLPSIEPDPEIDPPRLQRIGSQLQRLTDFADGSVMSELKRRGLKDADPTHQGTFRSWPHPQLDHITTTEDIDVVDFEVHEDVDLSDHYPISARLHLPRDDVQIDKK